jgi:hypothetical protein
VTTKEFSNSTFQDSRDSVRVEQVMVAVHDTIMETVTIVVRENEQGDTLRLEKTTERDRIRDRAQVKEKEERVVVKTDTVYIATRDSVSSSKFQGLRGSSTRASPVVSGLKWVFWIIVAVTVLVVVLRFKMFK